LPWTRRHSWRDMA